MAKVILLRRCMLSLATLAHLDISDVDMITDESLEIVGDLTQLTWLAFSGAGLFTDGGALLLINIFDNGNHMSRPLLPLIRMHDTFTHCNTNIHNDKCGHAFDRDMCHLMLIINMMPRNFQTYYHYGHQRANHLAPRPHAIPARYIRKIVHTSHPPKTLSIGGRALRKHFHHRSCGSSPPTPIAPSDRCLT